MATQQDSEAFGPMVAAEAYARHFFAAPRRAFVGDGQACNWTIQRKWFKDFVPISLMADYPLVVLVNKDHPAQSIAELVAWLKANPDKANYPTPGLTFTLPTRHLAHHYRGAWVGFDIFLALAFGSTAIAALRASEWLQPLAAITGTMLLCDAWFDVVTSASGDELGRAVVEAVFAEIPLAALCGWIVVDTKRFHDAVLRMR